MLFGIADLVCRPKLANREPFAALRMHQRKRRSVQVAIPDVAIRQCGKRPACVSEQAIFVVISRQIPLSYLVDQSSAVARPYSSERLILQADKISCRYRFGFVADHAGARCHCV